MVSVKSMYKYCGSVLCCNSDHYSYAFLLIIRVHFYFIWLRSWIRGQGPEWAARATEKNNIFRNFSIISSFDILVTICCDYDKKSAGSNRLDQQLTKSSLDCWTNSLIIQLYVYRNMLPHRSPDVSWDVIWLFPAHQVVLFRERRNLESF
jgi:hypothetical protein